MTMRLLWRTGSVFVGGVLALSVAACAKDETQPAEWGAEHPPSTVVGSTGRAAGPAASASAGSLPDAGLGSPSGGTDPAAPRPPDAPDVQPVGPLTLVRTGGFAGVSQTVKVDAKGGWTYDGNNDAGGPTSGRFTQTERQELRTLLRDPALTTQAGKPPAAADCTDGFSYSLVANSRTVRWQSCGTSAPPVAGAVARIIIQATPM